MQDTLHLQRLGCEEAVPGSKFLSGGVYDEKAGRFKGFRVSEVFEVSQVLRYEFDFMP
jgi:hypothetical protein